MSKRALKRQIGRLLAERDAMTKLLRSYAIVLADITDGPAKLALGVRMLDLEYIRKLSQEDAERLAAGLSSEKLTYSGRWLHARRFGGLDVTWPTFDASDGCPICHYCGNEPSGCCNACRPALPSPSASG